MPMRDASSTATRFLPSTMNDPIDIVLGPGAELLAWGRRTLGGVERAAHANDFDVDDEPCSARRRAIAQGGSRAATMNPAGLIPGGAVRPAHPRLAALPMQLARPSALKRAEPLSSGAASARAAC